MTSSNPTIQKLAARVKKDPGDSFSKFALALELLKEEKLQQGRVLFENIYQQDPQYVGVYYHLGKLYERIGQPEDACDLYKEGIEIANKQKKKRTKSELQEALAALTMELENE